MTRLTGSLLHALGRQGRTLHSSDAGRLTRLHDQAALACTLALPSERLSFRHYVVNNVFLEDFPDRMPHLWRVQHSEQLPLLRTLRERAMRDDQPVTPQALEALGLRPSDLPGYVFPHLRERHWEDLAGLRFPLLDPRGLSRIGVRVDGRERFVLDYRDAELYGYVDASLPAPAQDLNLLALSHPAPLEEALAALNVQPRDFPALLRPVRNAP